MKDHAVLLMDSVYDVCRSSKNIKGTFVKRLKNAARNLKEMVEVLAERTETEESRRMSRDNKLLRQQRDDLTEEVKAWKKIADEKREEAQKAWKSSGTHPALDWQEVLMAAVEKMGHSLQNTCGEMMNARFENLEERLLPKKLVRPPLAGDKKAMTLAPGGSKRQRSPAVAGESEPVPVATAATANTSTDGPPLGVEWAQLPAANPGSDPLNTELATWSMVARRQNKRPAKTTAVVVAPTPAPKPKPKVPSLPRSAAVILTLHPEARERGEDYRSVLSKVQERVSLTDCGITELSLRSTVTGSKIIEIPGSQATERADSLAAKLQEAVGDLAVVTRPVKRAEIRIVDIDDSVLREDVVKAVATKGGCEPAQIRAGEIRDYGRGMGVLFMSLPATAAKVLVEAGRVMVGWSSARVHALEARPLRCFRCLGVGHTRALCPSAIDRTATCFRCGENGHKAAVCVVVKPRCAICVEAGIPSEHVMGGVNCKPPQTKARGTTTLGLTNRSHVEVARAVALPGSEGTNMDQS